MTVLPIVGKFQSEGLYSRLCRFGYGERRVRWMERPRDFGHLSSRTTWWREVLDLDLNSVGDFNSVPAPVIPVLDGQVDPRQPCSCGHPPGSLVG